jgi:hypothetical protein
MTLVRFRSGEASEFNRNLTPSQPKSIVEIPKNTDVFTVLQLSLVNFPSWMSRVRIPSPALNLSLLGWWLYAK